MDLSGTASCVQSRDTLAISCIVFLSAACCLASRVRMAVLSAEPFVLTDGASVLLKIFFMNRVAGPSSETAWSSRDVNTPTALCAFGDKERNSNNRLWKDCRRDVLTECADSSKRAARIAYPSFVMCFQVCACSWGWSSRSFPRRRRRAAPYFCVSLRAAQVCSRKKERVNLRSTAR